MSFTLNYRDFRRDYWGDRPLRKPQGPNIGEGSSPLGPMKSAPMLVCFTNNEGKEYEQFNLYKNFFLTEMASHSQAMEIKPSNTYQSLQQMQK